MFFGHFNGIQIRPVNIGKSIYAGEVAELGFQNMASAEGVPIMGVYKLYNEVYGGGAPNEVQGQCHGQGSGKKTPEVERCFAVGRPKEAQNLYIILLPYSRNGYRYP